MATKKTKLFNLKEMHSEIFDEVALYFDVVASINETVEKNPQVATQFLINAVAEKFNRNLQWFLTMQEYHKQSIYDNIRGPQ